ncbi:MAG: malate dehydrogenase [Vicinamibacteria bacterium]|nr:malate dehydrogenase [Vicinamibacteria bacterium]
MRQAKITIVGAGNVGASAANIAATRDLGDIVLVDVVEGVPQGKALDMMAMRPIAGVSRDIRGTNSYDETAESDVVVMTAGLARQPGMSRDDLLAKNAEIVKSVSMEIVKRSPAAVLIMVTNPLDVMCYVAMKASGLPRERLFGQAGVLDSARMRCFIAMELGVSVEDVSACVLGGHGDSMVPLIHYTYAGGIPVEKLIPADRLHAIVARTRNAGGEIVSLLKTGSAYYSPAAAAIAMVEAVLRDKKRILPCATYLDGEYGIRGLFVGVPVILGASGVERILDVDLTGEEKSALQASADHVRQVMSRLKL